jgi:hypothetical protein
MLAWLFLAALAAADMPPPVADLSGAPAEPTPTVKERWSDLYAAMDRAQNKIQRGAVVVYSLHTDAKIPPHVFITSSPLYKTVVTGLLNGLYGDDWKKTGNYWILDKDEAVRKIAKAMGAKEKEEVAEIRDKIESELGPAMFMVYRVDHDMDDDDEKVPSIDSAQLSSGTAPAVPR